MQIVLVSHTGVASGMIEAVSFIIGKSAAFYAELDEHGIEKFKSNVIKIVSELDKKDDVILVSDIPAGSPGNTAFSILESNGLNVKYISGMNLGMLLELFLGKNVEKSIAAGVESIKVFEEEFNETESEEDF